MKMAYVSAESEDDYEQDDDFEAPRTREEADVGKLDAPAPAPRGGFSADSSPVEAEASLDRLEQRVSARLQVLERVKRCDIHAACWEGDVELVRAHLELAGTLAARGARAEVRVARRNLERLEREAAEFMAGGTTSRDGGGGTADEMEVGVAYAEKVDALAETVAAAAEKVVRAEHEGARAAANLEDETEFGDGYRPLHYAAYQGHAAVVAVLLAEGGADASACNGAGCTALFLATQQGKDACVDLLLDANDHKWCHRSQLAPTGEGRFLCALDVAQASNNNNNNNNNNNRTSSARLACRDLLVADLDRRPNKKRDGSDRPRRAPVPTVIGAGADLTNRAAGGLEVSWEVADLEDLVDDGAPPIHHIKVRVLDGETSDLAAVLVGRARAGAIRVPVEAEANKANKLQPGRSYVVMIAFVNGIGAAEYSPPSKPSKCAAPRPPGGGGGPPPTEAKKSAKRASGTPSSSSSSGAAGRPRRAVDPKIARARLAVQQNRAKRHRVQELMAKTAHDDGDGDLPHHPASPSSVGSRRSRPETDLDDVGPVASLPLRPRYDDRRGFIDLEDDDENDDDVFRRAPAPAAFQLASPGNSPNNNNNNNNNNNGALTTRDTDDLSF